MRSELGVKVVRSWIVAVAASPRQQAAQPVKELLLLAGDLGDLEHRPVDIVHFAVSLAAQADGISFAASSVPARRHRARRRGLPLPLTRPLHAHGRTACLPGEFQ
jgi:hypothetical protein